MLLADASFRRALCAQAAVAAGKRYVWAVDADNDGAGGMLFARLLTVINGCVAPEPTHRLTVPAVLESLTTLQHDVATTTPATGGGGNGAVAGSHVTAAAPAAGAAGNGTGAGSYYSHGVVAPPPVPGAPVFDVLAIVSALEALSIDASAVIDAIGGMSTSSLDALRTSGVPYVKCFAVKKALATNDGPAVPVKVCSRACLVTGRDDTVVPLWCVCTPAGFRLVTGAGFLN